MKSRSEIMDAINATIDKSKALTAAQERKHATDVIAAFGGAGFPSETKAKLAMVRKVRPNEGFRKGSVADSFGSTGHPSDELFPQGTGEIHEFSAEDLLSVGPKPDAPEYYERFRETMKQQYPTVPAMWDVPPPTQATSFEGRYSQSSAPKFEPTSGPPILQSPDKARTSTLQKSAGATRIAKLARLEELVTLLALYAGGNDQAGIALGIR